MAAVEEFQESDVFFSGDHHREITDPHHHRHDIRRQPRSSNKKQKKWSSSSSNDNSAAASSVPVGIPATVFRFGDLEELEDDEYEEEEAQGLVPPHVILARRVAGEMAFSVCTGNGRTLKGRDLSQVRNSILRMTGFLET